MYSLTILYVANMQTFYFVVLEKSKHAYHNFFREKIVVILISESQMITLKISLSIIEIDTYLYNIYTIRLIIKEFI